jgi:hypothetical protein
MSRPVARFAALAGAAAVVLGIATPMAAAADQHTATVHSITRPAPATVRLTADSRTVTVLMPRAHYTATDAHHGVVVEAAAATPVIGQTGTNVTPAYDSNVQQANLTSGGTAIAATTVATLLLLVVIGFALKHRHVKVTWVVLSAALGVFLSGSVFGALSTQLGGTAVSALSSIVSAF